MEKKKIKFNYVDVIIIVLVIVVFAFGYAFLNRSSGKTASGPKVSYTVEVKDADFEYKNNFAPGDKINDAVKGGELGVVTGVETLPFTEVITDTTTGQYRLGEYENRETVLITIEGTPTTFNDRVIMMGEQKISVGEIIHIKKAGCVGRGYVVKIETEEGKAND